MDNIIEEIIFKQSRDQKQKLVLIATLKPAILKLEHGTADKILANCVRRLSDPDVEKRGLAAKLIEILYQVIPEETIVRLCQVDWEKSREYHVLCSTLVLHSLHHYSSISYNQGRRVCELLANNKMLKFQEAGYRLVLEVLPQLRHCFTDYTQWTEVYFHYCGFVDKECSLADDVLHVDDQAILVDILKRIGMELAEGNLSYSQGQVLSNISDAAILNTSCVELVAALKKENLSKCLNNLVSLQTRGVPLSHWIMSLTNTLCVANQYLTVLQLSELYVDILTHQTDADSLKLLCYFLLLPQHSPLLFQRYYVKLEQINQDLQVECLNQTIEALMVRFPHFGRLYSGKGANQPACTSWATLHTLLSTSRLRFHQGVGFTNLGNTCYFNSILQALWLSSTFQHDVIFNQVESSILRELRRVFLNLSYSIRGSFSPDTLFHVIRPTWFSFGSQQDSAELLRHLFDLISSGTEQSVAGNSSDRTSPLHRDRSDRTRDPPAGLMGGDFSVESSKYNRRYCPSSKLETGADCSPSQIITKHFEGVQESTITCSTCHTPSSKQEKFLFLTLPCVTPDTVPPPSVADLITNSLATEHMAQDNQYSCEKCGAKRDALRTTALTKLPHTFIFTLNRFSYDKVLKCRSKLLTKVTVPSDITFLQTDSSFVVSERGEVHYKLYAVVVHSGSTTECGHYYTYGVPAHLPTDILSHSLCFDDATVSFVDSDLINSPRRDIATPYVLFYQRTSHEVVPTQDLDVADISDITNNNLRYLEQQQSQQNEARLDHGKHHRSNKDDDEDDNNRYVGGCHSNDFVAGSSRFIY